MAMNKDKMRLIQAQKKREQEKEWKEEFSSELGALRNLLEDDEIADEIPYAIRKQITALVEHNYATKVIFHHAKEKKDAPTDAEKMENPKVYSRCNVCETLIKTSLMSRHKQRAKCAETAKTRFHDTKFMKDKTAIPRVRVKERVAEMVEKYDVPEKVVVEAVLKQTRPTTEKEEKKLSKDIIDDDDEEESPEEIIKRREKNADKRTKQRLIETAEKLREERSKKFKEEVREFDRIVNEEYEKRLEEKRLEEEWRWQDEVVKVPVEPQPIEEEIIKIKPKNKIVIKKIKNLRIVEE